MKADGARDAGRDTRARLLVAAGELFATRGFHGTTIREIAARAHVNVAAGHYHCGSKKALYLEVLREEFARIWARLDTSGTRRAPRGLDRLSRRQLEALLQARIRVMLDVMVGPARTIHSTLVLREMLDPSEAVAVIVDEFIRPMSAELGEIVRRLEPSLPPDAVERCVMSLVGQAIFYRSCMPAVLRLWKRDTFAPALLDRIADHVGRFSAGGVARVGRTRREAVRG